MKKTLFTLFTLLSIASVAQDPSPSASLTFTCSLEGVEGSITRDISIDSNEAVGEKGCMQFAAKATYCYRFERFEGNDEVYLTFATPEIFHDGKSLEYIGISNLPYSEGSVSTVQVKAGSFKKKTLSCTFTNVNWGK